MAIGIPTRFPNGVSTNLVDTVMADYPLPDPIHSGSASGKDVFSYINDFVDLGNAASRTITGAGASFALTDGLGGIGVLSPASGVASSIYRTGAAFQFIQGNKFWFVHRLKCSSVAGNTAFYFGVIKTGAATTDSLLFKKVAATTTLSLVSTVNNVATTLVSNVTTVANDTFVDVGFYYDGRVLGVYVDDVLVTTITDVTVGSASTTLTNAMLTPITQIAPVATETISLDYAIVAQEVSR